jgi:hypothetical protein
MPVTSKQVIKIGDEEIWFDHEKILNVEAIAIEKAAGLIWTEVLMGLAQGRISAVSAIVWVIRKRTDPMLKFADVVFNVGDYEIIDPDVDERYAEPAPEPPVEDEPVPKDEPPVVPSSEPSTGPL